LYVVFVLLHAQAELMLVDYTYPPIVHDSRSVSIDTPYHTRAQRLKYQGVLQKHFGLNTKQELDELAVLARPPILPLSHTFVDAKVPYGYAPIANFRRCFIEVVMPRDGFSGSHRLDLNATLGGKRVPLGYVSVLSRLQPERCGNCVQLASEGRPISGRIMLPAVVTLKLLDQHEMGVEHTGEAHADPFHGLKHGFDAGIATPGNHPLANADPSGMTALQENSPGLESEATPKLTLWSAAVAHPEDDPDGAIELFDWKSHGTLFDGKSHGTQSSDWLRSA
jgi:tyrosinase